MVPVSLLCQGYLTKLVGEIFVVCDSSKSSDSSDTSKSSDSSDSSESSAVSLTVKYPFFTPPLIMFENIPQD